MRLVLFALFSLLTGWLNANIYTDINAQLPYVYGGSVSWCDYDLDGDSDLLVTGRTEDEPPLLFTKLYNNNNGVFTWTGQVFTGVYQSSIAWTDIDNDNDPDFLIMGNSGNGTDNQPITTIYRNRNGELNEMLADVVPVSQGAAVFIDYDRDGDVDLFICGNSSFNNVPVPITKLYRNDELTFVDSGIEFPNLYQSALMAFDYDNDGDEDILMAGNMGTDLNPVPVTKLMQNNNGVFSEQPTSLPAVRFPSMDWTDMDHDGDADIIFSGMTSNSDILHTAVFRNDFGSFTELPSDFYAVAPGSLQWGDFDNDGDSDVLYVGNSLIGGLVEPITTIYRNDDSLFMYIYDSPVTVLDGMAQFCDYNGDGDLDIALTGNHPICPGGPVTRIYRNAGVPENHEPTVPSGVNGVTSLHNAILSWNMSSDVETPAASLTYNLRMGSTPGGSDVLSPLALSNNGQLLLPHKGNNGYRRTRKVPSLPDGTYYWCVQALDDAFGASAFSPEQTLIVNSTMNEDIAELAPSLQISPNPFHNEVRITTYENKGQRGQVAVFDLKGRKLRNLTSNDSQSYLWDGRDAAQQICASGIYLIRYEQSGRPSLVRKIIKL